MPKAVVKMDAFGQCGSKTCECFTSLYRQHCTVCGKIMHGQHVMQNEGCPECVAKGHVNLK